MIKLFQFTVILLFLSCSELIIPQPTAFSTVNVDSVINPDVKLLLGISFDSRTSLNGPSFSAGYYNSNGTIIPSIDSIFGDFPLSTLRYPANGIMQGFQWKKSIGPIENRQAQILFGSSSTPQVVEFGFDEFMEMTAEQSVDPKDIQIMVPIYDSASTNLTATQMRAAIPDPARFNADWVEYANAPNDSSNWGGGKDWAAERAANGRHEPYGIELWNLGNEPYTSNEFGIQGCSSYVALITPIIDSMLAIDPTIKITLTTPGRLNSAWTTYLLDSTSLASKIYGLNSHYFPDETVVGGTIPLGVATFESHLEILAETVDQNYGLKMILGDYAHGIPLDANGNPTGDPDLAMQWQGANLSMDFLLMMSQIPNIERSNFWVYGLTTSVWHPIRKNADGSYTLMPQASLYKILNPLFLDKSISVTNFSPAGSDGNPYSVRSGAFIKNDLTELNIISVNRDKIDTHVLRIAGLDDYLLDNARLLSAEGLTSEVFSDSIVTADSNGDFILPPMSVLILEYKDSDPLSVELDLFYTSVEEKTVTLSWRTASEINNYGFEIERSFQNENALEKISFVPGKGNRNSFSEYSFIDNSTKQSGTYYYRLKQVDSGGGFKYYNSKEVEIGAPLTFELLQNFPNPFNPTTNLGFQIPAYSEDNPRLESVTLKVYDVLGKEIAVLINEVKTPGFYEVTLDASALSSGIYFYSLQAGNFKSTKKMVLLR